MGIGRHGCVEQGSGASLSRRGMTAGFPDGPSVLPLRERCRVGHQRPQQRKASTRGAFPRLGDSSGCTIGRNEALKLPDSTRRR